MLPIEIRNTIFLPPHYSEHFMMEIQKLCQCEGLFEYIQKFHTKESIRPEALKVKIWGEVLKFFWRWTGKLIIRNVVREQYRTHNVSIPTPTFQNLFNHVSYVRNPISNSKKMLHFLIMHYSRHYWNKIPWIRLVISSALINKTEFYIYIPPALHTLAVGHIFLAFVTENLFVEKKNELFRNKRNFTFRRLEVLRSRFYFYL